MADQARRVAYELLQAVSRDDGYANLVLPRLLDSAALTGRDAGLATELGYGTLRASGVLDEILSRCATRPLDDIELGVLDLLRLGSYQLLKTRIPPHAAVATTVSLARTVGHARSAGFINAILRKVASRDFDGWGEQIGAGASELGRLALRFSHPGWIVAAFEQALGGPSGSSVAELADLLEADDARPDTHLVAWPGRCDPAELVEQSDGEAGPYSPFAVRMAGGRPADIAAVREHRAGVQDEGSQLCAWALTRFPDAVPEGNADGIAAVPRWLDLCAGPGGKAALLAALAAEAGAELVANELHPHRAELIAAAVAGWPVEIRIGDGRTLIDHAGFDRILLDAPCTGLGALRRRPEARWRKSPADLQELVRLQADLLDAAAGLLRVGGVLAYVTCSPHPAETTAQVSAVLKRHPALELVPAGAAFGSIPRSEAAGLAEAVQLWPHRHGTDAMFFAAFRRNR
ncbi:hypothetical protein M6D93_08720 [Jatrophihabitans telluris]|uniref:SAM-dependent MTase RsmB/NOP-type domain-containing protein n=1 Tax=Jatrophihabitans telluris TaxID=2038343 RepID=A0ABY4R5U2_9ACTN|nr:transcription antitermination factor NusB [Jatrophihabitans telluris]UQX90069.1 hypothetical protein M6D93_08720 [Jatrophihabitans telluris]